MEHIAKFVLIIFVEIASSSKKLFQITSARFVNRFTGTIGFISQSCNEASVES